MHVYFVKHYFWLKYEGQFKLQQDSSPAVNLGSPGKFDDSKYSLGLNIRQTPTLQREKQERRKD